MKTLTKNLVKRSLSVLLVLMMVFSLLTVGLTSASAAKVELAETGATVTFAEGDYIYVKNFTPSGWSANWFHSDVYEWVHIWNSSVSNSEKDIQLKLIEGTENAVGAVYGAAIPAGTYTHVIFTRSHSSTDPWNNCNQTGDIPLHATFNCYTNLTVGGTGYTGSVYTPPVSFDGEFWADVDGEVDTTYDKIEPEGGKLYLPSANVTLFVSEGTLEIDDYTVTPEGTEVDLESNTYTLGGDFSGSLNVLRSANVSSIHTETNVAVPQGTYQGYEHKDDYETKGKIGVFAPDGTQKNSDTILKKIKGRGNSSWEASHKIIGKYAFNITLDKKAKLLDESSKSKKFCLVSYNADEARMRNMVVYELAQQIGVNYVPDYEPVDFYNNGKYIGSYLLTDKVEIGDPLVDIVNLDDVNNELNAIYDAEGEIIGGTNFDIYEADDVTSYRGYYNGSSSTETTKGYYKYVNLEECDASEYEDSGFLLEFELHDRFPAEISGFISNKGQQIVCKYPEYASKNQIEFIMNKWNTAEALMYDDTATYAELDAVIDVESFAKMYLIQELSKNLDGGATSFYVYYDGGKLHAGVAWDYDWTLGQYEKTYTDRVQAGSDFSDQVNADPSDWGGWYLNSKKIYAGSDFNAQAALCQNDAFWSVVVAEWDEIFYSEARKFTNGTSSTISAMDGIIAEFYNQVKASTAMDEDKWGLIARDLFITNNWGSTDTGDTHDAAVVWLDDWMNNRLGWMDKYISRDGSSHTGIYNIDYIIQPPVIEVDKDSYQMGDTVTLTIDDKTDGDFTYTIYKNGEEMKTTTDKSLTVAADSRGETKYTVKAKSNVSQKESALSSEAVVNVEGFKFNMEVTAPETVMVGDTIEIIAKTNSDQKVDYELHNTTGGNDELVETNETGEFVVSADTEGTLSFKLYAKTTVEGEVFTDECSFDVIVNPFVFNVTLDAPESVEAGLDIILKAKATSDTDVLYTFYDGNGNLLESNSTGTYVYETTQEDLGKSFIYYVEAETTVLGQKYTASTVDDKKTVPVTEVKDAYDVKIYFKSTTTFGYTPIINTEGAVSDLVEHEMVKDTNSIYICKNKTQTASYYWFEADVQVSKASPVLDVSLVSSRYAMEGDIRLNITQSGSIYLAINDLNAGYEVVDLTDWDEVERNWCGSAVRMVYDEERDGIEALQKFAESYVLRTVGDTNGDGTTTIKDVTLMQKSIANLATLDATSSEVSDIDGDGDVTIKDATALQKAVAGL